jgi:hypothetical protein
VTGSNCRHKSNRDEKQDGFSAEEVPELVSIKDRKGLSPMSIVTALGKIVQMQQRGIEELKIILKHRNHRNLLFLDYGGQHVINGQRYLMGAVLAIGCSHIDTK